MLPPAEAERLGPALLAMAWLFKFSSSPNDAYLGSGKLHSFISLPGTSPLQPLSFQSQQSTRAAGAALEVKAHEIKFPCRIYFYFQNLPPEITLLRCKSAALQFHGILGQFAIGLAIMVLYPVLLQKLYGSKQGLAHVGSLKSSPFGSLLPYHISIVPATLQGRTAEGAVSGKKHIE